MRCKLDLYIRYTTDYEILDESTLKNGTVLSVPAPSVQDIIGISLKHIGSYKQMDNKKQVVALIDDVR